MVLGRDMKLTFKQDHVSLPAAAHLHLTVENLIAGLGLNSATKLMPPNQLEGLIQEAHRQLEEINAFVRQNQSAKTAPDWTDMLGRPSGMLELKLLGTQQVVMGGYRLDLRPRFIELLCVMALHPEGLTGEQLALAVWGEATDPSVVKTELCRLRSSVPLESRPYRLGVEVKADFVQMLLCLREGDLLGAVKLYRGPLLPRSEAPEVIETRTLLEETLRRAVMKSGDFELIWYLAERLNSDLELWEAAQKSLPELDNRRAIAQAQIALHKSRWQESEYSRAV